MCQSESNHLAQERRSGNRFFGAIVNAARRAQDVVGRDPALLAGIGAVVGGQVDRSGPASPRLAVRRNGRYGPEDEKRRLGPLPNYVQGLAPWQGAQMIRFC